MTVKEAEDIIDDIIFIINEFYIYKSKNREETKNNSDFVMSLDKSIKYLEDYRRLLEDKINSATLDL